MDYLVAARGYGLALGFQTLALYLFSRMLVHPGPPSETHLRNQAVAMSICAGLSLCANFSFAYADIFLLLIFALWACLKQRRYQLGAWWRITVACLSPAIVVVFVLAGSVLTNFPRSQLFWGTDSWKRTWRDIHDACFSELNYYLVNPLLSRLLNAFQRQIVNVELGLVVVYVFVILAAKKQLQGLEARSRFLLAGSLASVLVLSILAHWLQFKVLNIPLPFERTSLFIVPLATTVVGALFAVPPLSRLQRVVHSVGIAGLCITSFYFIGALRDSYFREWRLCADIKAAFPVVVDLCRRIGLREVASDPNYPASFNFYRTLYKVADIDEFRDFDTMPSGKRIYVLPEYQYEPFMRAEGLQVVYHGGTSDLVIAIKPAAADLATRDK
jgi:hypothetical protein